MGFSGTFLYLISRSQQDSSEIRHCWTRAVLASHKWFDDVNTANSKGNNFLCAIGWYAHVRAWNALESTAEVPILFSKTKTKLPHNDEIQTNAKFYTFGCDAVACFKAIELNHGKFLQDDIRGQQRTDSPGTP